MSLIPGKTTSNVSSRKRKHLCAQLHTILKPFSFFSNLTKTHNVISSFLRTFSQGGLLLMLGCSVSSYSPLDVGENHGDSVFHCEWNTQP